ncbi:MAG: hypothetical protein QOE14_1224 [Humisphaera sp.]|nr:hypothetical protein [Humisphaera sp.]
MTQQTPARRSVPWRILAPIVIVAAGVIAYANTLTVPFIFDDLPAIVDNPSIRKLWPPQEALIAPPRNTFAGRPIVNLSFAINYALFGPDDVRGYHATNIFIHICTAIVLFAVLRRTFRTPRLRERFGRDADGLALAATLLWEVHPLLSEVVTYTSTRTEGLMALFLLLTLYFAIRAFESERRSRSWQIAAVCACAIGMGCKEVMAAAPLLVYLYDALLVSDSLLAPARRRPMFYLALAATWVIVPVMLFAFVNLTAKSGMGFQRTTPWVYALTQSSVIVHYLRLALWPNRLTIDYFDWPLAHSIADVWPQLLFMLALVGVTIWGIVRRKPVALLAAWVLIILAPTSSIVPLGSEIAAERRMYLPLIALVTGGVVLAHRLLAQRRGVAAGIAVGVVAVALLAMTIRRNGDYATSVTIWTDAATKRPHNLRSLSELARVLQLAGRSREARPVAERVVAIDPNYPQARALLGALLIGEGHLDAAEQHLRAAVQLDPQHALTRTNLGLALARQGKTDNAIAEYRAALRVDENFVDAHVYLADALAAQGDVARALTHLETALRLQPDAPDIRRRYERLRK